MELSEGATILGIPDKARYPRLPGEIYDIKNGESVHIGAWEGNAVPMHQALIFSEYAEDITISGLAAKFGFERSYLYRIFKQRYGVGPKDYLTRVRLEKAKWLLGRGYSVAECAYMVGYSDSFIFSKAYKKCYGVAPSLDDHT